MDATTNALNWFEISVSDIARAKKFYETVFGLEMPEQEMMGIKMAFFPAEDMNGKVSGALCQSEQHKPSMDGAVIYLNGNPDLSDALGKIEAAGGQILMGKTHISPEVGNMAFFMDCEGNKLGLHSNN